MPPPRILGGDPCCPLQLPVAPAALARGLVPAAPRPRPRVAFSVVDGTHRDSSWVWESWMISLQDLYFSHIFKGIFPNKVMLAGSGGQTFLRAAFQKAMGRAPRASTSRGVGWGCRGVKR